MTAGRKEESCARARDLHARVPVIVIHDHEPLADDLDKCRAGGIAGKVYLPVLDIKIQPDAMVSGTQREGWARHALEQFGAVFRQIGQSDGRIIVATRAEDFERARSEGRSAVLLGSEGGKLIEGSLDLLHSFYRMGLRFIGLTWAYPNQISNMDDPAKPGLTAFGRELIPAMNDLGMIIDNGHAGARTFYDTIELSRRPIVMSHAGAAGAVAASRHPDWPAAPGCFADDAMLKALAKNGGVIGIHFFGPVYFRTPQGFCDITLEDVLAHVEYVAALVGPEVLALGCDYFPDYGEWAELQRSQNSTPDHFVVRKARLYEFTAALLDRGWKESDVVGILGGNFLRVCRQVLRKE